MVKLWCFDDAHNWGLMLAKQAQEMGHDAHTFDDPNQPDEGYAFFHMHHHPQVRTFHKRCMAIMALNPDLLLIPDYRASVLYDDKLEQARQLAKWTPRSRIFYAPGRARGFLERSPTYPFASRASEGSAPMNTRLVANADQAKLEVRQAFSDLGIPIHYEQKQIGYLLWQDHIPSDGDIRIIAVGTKRLIQKRRSSGRNLSVQVLDEESRSALAVANAFFAEEKFGWGAVDLVKDPAVPGRWYVLDFNVGWNLPAYYECAFHNEDGTRAGPLGDKIWQVFMEELSAGSFG